MALPLPTTPSGSIEPHALALPAAVFMPPDVADDEVVMMREYARMGQYQRDARRLCRQGWQVVSVIDRPAPFGRLRRLTGGLASLGAPRSELLVTYRWHRAASHAVPAPRGALPAWQRALGAIPVSVVWWTVALVLLTALLAYGVLGFVAA